MADDTKDTQDGQVSELAPKGDEPEQLPSWKQGEYKLGHQL